MKPSILTVVAAFVATTFAAPNLFVRDTSVGNTECGFFAAVNYPTLQGTYHHCWIEAVLPSRQGNAPPCGAIASSFMSDNGGKTPSCRMFMGHQCTASKGLGVQGSFCSGYNHKVPQADDQRITKTLMNCLLELKPPGTDPRTWRTKCEPKEAPKYDTFKGR
ncbi:hypothetical protein BG006_010483 [Podila minutissima]|uniref:Uncharacterized protein n=1 Tax=Podila minutissima TaxID=64525 RepID=A0A9P5SQE5_9FUNG|nr:hypothetical protein BG006_010483 [Podila minutissima]